MAYDPLDPTPRLTPAQKRAKRVMRKLVRDPEAFARNSVAASAKALLPDDPAYLANLADLDAVVRATPGTRPDTGLAMLATGLDPDTEVGGALVSAQSAVEQKQELIQQQQEQLVQAQEDAARAAEEASGPMGYVKAFSQTLFAAAEAPFQILTNVGRNLINSVEPGGTASDWGSIFANTDLGILSMGASDYYSTGNLSNQFLDVGDGFFINEDSPVATLRKNWDQQMLGTAGQNMKVEEVDEVQLDGTTKRVRKIVDASPATLGQYTADRVFQLQEGTAPYSVVSGLFDVASRAADPSMYVGVKNVNSAFVTGENLFRSKVLGQASDKLLPSADNVTAATDAGALSQIGQTWTTRVEGARLLEDAGRVRYTDSEKRFLEASDELDELRRGEADVLAAREAEAQQATKKLMIPGTAQTMRDRNLEGLADQTDLVFEEQAQRGADDLAAMRRKELEERYTPRPDQEAAAPSPAAQADPADEEELARLATEWDRANRNRRSDLWFEEAKANVDTNAAFDRAAANGADRLPAHGMAKETTLTGAVDQLLTIVREGLDPNRGRALADGTPRLDTGPLAAADARAGAGVGTGSGAAYRDGPFILVGAEGGSLAGKLDDLRAVLVNPAHDDIVPALQAALDAIRPGIRVDSYRNVDQIADDVLSSRNAPSAPAPASAAVPDTQWQAESLAETQRRTEAVAQWEQSNAGRLPAMMDAPPKSALGDAQTGQPFRFVGFRGAGRARDEVYNGPQVAFAGDARYVAPTEDLARQYGDDITQEAVELANPLVLRTDEEWRALQQQGLPMPDTMMAQADAADAAAGLKEWITSRGYDGIVVDPSPVGDAAKSLRNKFGHAQVVDYGAAAPRRAAATPAEGSVHAVLREDGKFDLIHRATGGRVAERDTLEEAESLASEMSRMAGYADEVPLEDLRAYDYVRAELDAPTPPRAETKPADPAAPNDGRVEPVAAPEPRPIDEATNRQLKQFRTQIQAKQIEVDALRESRDTVRSELEALRKKRLNDETELRYRAKKTAESLKVEINGDTADDYLDFMRRAAGLQVGGRTLDVDKAVAFITGNSDKNVSRLFKAMALIDDTSTLYNMTKGRWTAALRRDIAKATTEDEVRAVLARHIAQGDFNPNVGKLRGIRTAAQVRLKKDSDVMLSRYGKVFGEPGLKAVAYGKQITRSNVPWANARHVEDEDGMADLVYDTATYVLSMNKIKGKRDRGFLEASAFRNEWMRKMDAATTGFERRKVWNQFNTEMVNRAGRDAGLTDDELKLFQERMSLSHRVFNDTTAYLAEVRAAAKGEPLKIDGKEYDWSDIAALEAQLSNRVFPPNWDEIRRAMKSTKEIRSIMADEPRWQDSLDDIVGSVFERYWRASVIAFRGAYVLRNMADIQLRMYLRGHPSMFTNPQGVLALAFSHIGQPTSWSGKKLEKFNQAVDKALHKRIRADGRLDGDPMVPDDPDMDLQTYFASPFMDLMAGRDTSYVDVGVAAKPDQSAFKSLGYQVSKIGDDGVPDKKFFDGWEFEIGLLQNSPLARAVLDVESGNIPKHLQKIMDDSGGVLGPREALVRYYTQGSGRKILDNARSGSDFIRTLTGDPDMDGGAGLYSYLFGDSPLSIVQRWDRMTLQRDPEIMNLAVRRKPVKAEEWRAQKRQMVALLKKRARSGDNPYMIKNERGTWIENPDNPLPVREVQTEILDREDGHRLTEFFDKGLTWFFTKSGRFEHAAGYLPEFRYNKWDQAADLVKALSPEDAAVVAKNARKILGGKQLPNSWAAMTLRRLESNAKKAKGSGAFKIADLDRVTDEYAGKQVQDMFYNALNRNQFANAMRLVAPFAQPWANTLKEWTRLGLQNPNRVYAAGVVYSAGTGRGSNWLTDDPTNPNDAFFYRHPKTGQMMVGVPLMGPAIAGLASGISAIKGGPGISPDMVEGGVSLQSMNLAVQNSLLPGAGPMLSISASMLEDTGWYQSWTPDVVKQFLQPYVNTDPDADPTVASTLMPAWLQGILGGAFGVPDFTGKAQRYLQPTMGYLLQQNPDGRYGSVDASGNWVQNSDQQSALLRDAEQLASALLFGRSVLQNVSPGAPIPEILATADDGRLLSTTVLTQEYLDKLGETGDRGEALLSMADQYGTSVLFTLLPTRGKSITPTDEAYQFLKSDPTAAEKYGSTLALFAPGGGYSQRFDRFQRKTGGNPSLSAEEMAREVNSLMRSAKEAELDRKLEREEITAEEYEAQIQALQESYKGIPTTNLDEKAADVLRADLKRNAEAPEMQEAFPEVANAVKLYEQYRQYALDNNATETLEGAGNVEWRAWLRKKGTEIVASNPKFRVAWVKAYAPELKED